MVSAIKGDNVYKFFTWLISSLCMIMASLLGLLYWNVKDELKDTREINVIQTQAIAGLCAELSASKEDRRHIQVDLGRIQTEIERLKSFHMRDK